MAIWKPNIYKTRNIYKREIIYRYIVGMKMIIFLSTQNIYSYHSLLMTRMVRVSVTPATVPSLFPFPLKAVRLPDLLTITYSWKHNTGVNEML